MHLQCAPSGRIQNIDNIGDFVGAATMQNKILPKNIDSIGDIVGEPTVQNKIL